MRCLQPIRPETPSPCQPIPFSSILASPPPGPALKRSWTGPPRRRFSPSLTMLSRTSWRTMAERCFGSFISDTWTCVPQMRGTARRRRVLMSSKGHTAETRHGP
jgi:hypothetical protein